jgi:hypothetical protein
MRWQAPELLSPDETHCSSKASDIYAFACVCYEVRYQAILLKQQKLTT